jgi:hypothetical protein
MSSVAARDLAGMYWQGRCVSRNKDLARLWYEREAAFGGVGPADAQEHLACIDQPSSPDCSGSEAWAARGGRNYAQATLIEKCETAIDNNNWQQFADLGCPQPQTPNPGPSSRETLSALLTGVTQGMNQVAAARNQNRGSTSAIATYSPPTPPAYNTQTYATNMPVYDNALDQCVRRWIWFA